MKNLSILIVSSLLAFQVSAVEPEKSKEQLICENLTLEAEDICTKEMCAYYSNEESSECFKDGDFYEGLGICVYDDILPILIEKHNKIKANIKIKCE